MFDSASDRALVPLYSDVARRLQQMGASAIITEAIDKQAILASMMEKRNLTYLSLPPVLAALAADPIYQKALYWGRGLYYDALHAVDDAGKLVRVPVPFDRPAIFEYMKETLTLDDPRIAIAVPLAWRVGLVVGWLSGVAVSKSDDAQSALLVLVALVAPLLSTAAGDTHEITSFKRSLLKRGKR